MPDPHDFPSTAEQLAAVAIVEKIAATRYRSLKFGGSLRSSLSQLRNRIASDAENDAQIGAEFSRLVGGDDGALSRVPTAQLGAIIRASLANTGHTVTPPPMATEEDASHA